MAEPTPPPPVRRTPGWVKLLLAVSLALNLAVIGLVAGVASRGGGPRGPAAVNYALPYVMALPGSDRRAVFRTMRTAERADTLPDRGARAALYREMLTALRRTPFEPAAVVEIMDRQTAASLQVQDLAQSIWLERVKAMSPEDRADYAYRVEEILRRGPHHGDRKRKPARAKE